MGVPLSDKNGLNQPYVCEKKTASQATPQPAETAQQHRPGLWTYVSFLTYPHLHPLPAPLLPWGCPSQLFSTLPSATYRPVQGPVRPSADRGPEEGMCMCLKLLYFLGVCLRIESRSWNEVNFSVFIRDFHPLSSDLFMVIIGKQQVVCFTVTLTRKNKLPVGWKHLN